MQNQKELNHLSVHSRATNAAGRNNRHPISLQETKHRDSGPLELDLEPDTPFPYLETIVTAAKRYPHAALAAMISIASVVIAAVTVLAVSVIGGMFLMYGEMRQNTALMGDILKKQQVIETRQLDDGKVMRAYESANGKRIEFVVGLMTKEQQQRMNEYDRTHPAPLMPEKEN